MKMRYKKSSPGCGSFNLKPKDLVAMKTVWADSEGRYLVIKVSNKSESIDLLPLEEFYMDQRKKEAPILSVPFYMIEKISRIDKGDLLFLANHGNPHIINALESL
tara:strand:- start:45 stop:359 length:315 start_codon:yes stop_codon:yes gene_type:complete